MVGNTVDETAMETGQKLLSRQIAMQLRTMIAADELKAGAPLRERTLAVKLNVSRTPLREALKILAGDGLVTLQPNRGAVVTVFSAREIQEKLDVLGLVEGFAGQEACRLGSDAEIAEIRALHHEMLAAYERQDRRGYFRLNQAIHAGIVMAAHNQTLFQVHEMLNRQLFRYRYQGSSNAATWQTAIGEHNTIIDLLSNRAAEKLDIFLQRHVRSTWEKIKADFASDPRTS